MIKSILLKFVTVLGLAVLSMGAVDQAALAQSAETEATAADRTATGGAQTLEDILRRQRGEAVLPDQGEIGPSEASDATPGALAVRGGASDSALWRAVGQGREDVFSSAMRDPNATRLVQREGEDWLAMRNGPVLKYTGWAIGGMLVLLALFFTIRGRIKISGGRSGVRIERFKFIERFGHWLLAISFIALALTGFSVLAGREALVPGLDWANGLINGETADPNYGSDFFTNVFVPWLALAKPIHNSIAWAFMLSLVLVFVMWVIHNIPGWTDIKWLAKGGGIIGKGHPDAKKFNAGQKIIFWSVILMGASVSASGIMLLMPGEYAMFSPTFEKLNTLGAAVGYDPKLAVQTTQMQEQQYAATWHTIVAVVMTVIVLAHIYIGTVGMQGAFAAMGSGKVDLNWAKEHHNLWVDKLERDGKLIDVDSGTQTSVAAVSKASNPAE